METTTINELPVLTWNWLKINNALMQNTPSAENFTASGYAVSDLPAGVTCRLASSEEKKHFSHIETGAGKNADIYFSESETILVTAAENIKAQKPVVITLDEKDATASHTQQIIRAEKNSSIAVIIVYTSEKNAKGFEAVRTLCSAAENAYIHLIKVQLLGNGFIQIDDTGSECGENGRSEVTQIILGGKETYTGIKASLPAYKASFKSDSAYLCLENQKLDMNYVVLHTGKKTDCKMTVKGTLSGNAVKTYRGSIDFRRGCSGSTGNEQEETLLLSPSAVNKSIPLILCDEEDVAGEHGASIGRLGEDVLFYMQSRGISKHAAEQIMARAKVTAAASLIPDEATTAQISSFLDEVFSHE